jgi:hypothetical protein
MDRAPELPVNLLDETSPRFALRLDIEGLSSVIAGLLPSLIGANHVRSLINSVIQKHTGLTELTKLRELKVFLGPQTDPDRPGRRQLQVRLSGDWTPASLIADLKAHPSPKLRLEERDGRVLLFPTVPADVTGHLEADGALVFASNDLPRGLLGEIAEPSLPVELEERFRAMPLFALSRKGGPWWNAVSDWINTRLPAEDAELHEAVRQSLQQICLFLDEDDDVIIDGESQDLTVAERLTERLESLRVACVGHLAPERLDPGPQQTSSPVFRFFTMPLAAAMPLLQTLRRIIQQIKITREFKTVRVRLPLRIICASLSSPIALLGLLPAIPMLLASAASVARPAMNRLYSAFADQGCADVRHAVGKACQAYCRNHPPAADPAWCPDMQTLILAGHLDTRATCPHGGHFHIRREEQEFRVTCSVHGTRHAP